MRMTEDVRGKYSSFPVNVCGTHVAVDPEAINMCCDVGLNGVSVPASSRRGFLLANVALAKYDLSLCGSNQKQILGQRVLERGPVMN